MNSLTRFSRSIRNHGMAKTLENVLAVYDDCVFDFLHGSQTNGTVSLNNVTICGQNKHLGRQYEGTRARALRALLRTCNFPEASVFVDFGCGKGKALLIASNYLFKRIVGIDFSPELCEIAKNNVRAYTMKRGASMEINVIACDAAAYEIKDDENVFYFFNPFKACLLEQVVNNIAISFTRHRRPVWIIYNNPIYSDVLDSEKRFNSRRVFTYGSSVFHVYQNRM